MTIARGAEKSAPPSPPSNNPWRSEPAPLEVLALWLVTCLVFVTGVSFPHKYPALVDDFGDSGAYMALASAIRHWDFHGVVVKQFWGLPYAMAGRRE